MVVAEPQKVSQRAALIDAAERAIAAHGTGGLKARDVARDVGVAVGAIYNLVADLDELHLHVAARTLRRLDDALEAAATSANADPTVRLVAIALAYRRFASENFNLWRALFEHRMAPGRAVPQWAVADQTRLFRHIQEPLALLTPPIGINEVLTRAQTLFGAVHGIVSLGLEERFIGVSPSLLDSELEQLVRATCVGLRTAI